MSMQTSQAMIRVSISNIRTNVSTHETLRPIIPTRPPPTEIPTESVCSLLKLQC